MIIFKTKHHADVTMFDKHALNLIRLMGHSETVPGALNADEVETAFKTLKQALSTSSAQSGDSWEEDSVSLSHRGRPLLDLLQNAIQENEHVIWENSLL